jgi:hypothetical protein
MRCEVRNPPVPSPHPRFDPRTAPRAHRHSRLFHASPRVNPGNPRESQTNFPRRPLASRSRLGLEPRRGFRCVAGSASASASCAPRVARWNVRHQPARHARLRRSDPTESDQDARTRARNATTPATTHRRYWGSPLDFRRAHPDCIRHSAGTRYAIPGVSNPIPTVKLGPRDIQTRTRGDPSSPTSRNP